MLAEIGTLLTEQQVADIFGVTVHGVKKWRLKGLIGYIKIGKTIRFEEAEVNRFKQVHSVASACKCTVAADPEAK